jgi:biopolymer transport protein ExbB
MTFLLLAQAAAPPVVEQQGWLTSKLLNVTLSSAEWVLWLLIALSVISIGIMLERAFFFLTHRLPNADEIAALLARGDLSAAKARVAGREGMEATIVRDGIAAIEQGADSVDEVLEMTKARERPRYERFLSFLGTVGSNSPFVGLFGTVLGIIKAFHDLGQLNVKGAAIQQTVMRGISEALVATAVGLAVALPAVAAYNLFTRWLKGMMSSTNALGHGLMSHLRSAREARAGTPVRPVENAIREVR